MRALRPAAVIVVVGVVVVLVFGQQYVGSVFVLALCYGIVTAGMAVQIGFSQQIVFSQCVFMAFGAYGVAMLNTHWSVPSLLATPVVMVASGLAALLLGSIVTRASGLALAVATLMLPLIATGYISSAGYLGGSVGAPLTGNLWAGSTTQSIAIGNGLITVAVLGLVVLAAVRILSSDIGLELYVLGVDEPTAAAMGVRTPRRRLELFVLGSVFAALGGAIYAGTQFYEDQLASVQQLIVPRHYTRVALLEDNCGSVCLANQGTVQKLAAQFGFKLVSTQIDQVGATDVTPQVLAMLAAKPQIILFGLVPGTDSITAIRAIRAQNANIPISECSACELPSFVAAAGGASAMHNIYILGSMQSWLNAASKGTSAQARQTATGLKEYFTGMKAAGYTSENQLDNSQEGWDAGLEINWAVTSAGTLDETAVMHKLQHLDINTLGIVWARTPANYENISQVLAAMEIIGPDGGVTLYDATKTK